MTLPEAEKLSAPVGTYWIGSSHPFDLHEVYLNFRADVWLDRRPETARLFISADSRYRLWLNGFPVGDGPERSWPAAMAVDDHDVAGLVSDKPRVVATFLTAGVNRIAVQVYSPGYSHFAHVHRAACGMIAWLEVDGRVIAQSDSSWRVQRDLRRSSRVARISIYGSGVEDCDEGAGFSDRAWPILATGGWDRARILQPPDGPVWQGLRRRRTPQPVTEIRRLSNPWQLRLAPSLPTSADPHDDLCRLVRSSQTVPALTTIPAGMTGLWIFDLGVSTNYSPNLRLEAQGGEKVLVSNAEKLQDDEILLPDPATYCRMRPTDRFTLWPPLDPPHPDYPTQRQLLEGFAMRGGRYVIFAIEGRGHDPNPRFLLRVQHYPLDERPLPDLGDARLNAVAQMCRRTILACLRDGFVDSVWRESSQWLGDVVPEAFALMAISDDPRPLRFAIDMAVEGAAPDGILPSVLPGEVPSYVVTDYNFSWIELLAMYRAHPGATDAETVLQQHWPSLTRMLARFRADLDPDGLLRSQPGRRLFLDWSGQDRSEPNLTYNLRYLHALRTAASLNPAAPDAAVWLREADALAATLRQTHYLPDGWRESPAGVPACQLALSLLILTETVTGAEAETLADRITARSLDLSDVSPPGTLMLASPFMHHYVFQALDHLNRRADIRAIIAARWGRWARAGEATTWENWDISFPDGSACHGFSAHPLGWLHR